MLQRIFVDGAWVRAIFGSANITLWILGSFLGFTMSKESNWTVLPLSIELLIAIIFLSILDATAGFFAWITVVVLALVNGNLDSWVDIRTTLGLGIAYFSLPLLAHAIRPLRRKPEKTLLGTFDRIADYIMPPVFVAFAGTSMIKALDGLSGLKITSSEDHSLIKLAIGCAFICRLVGEDIVAYLYPQRMLKVQPQKLVSSSKSMQSVSILLRVILMALMTVPYFGLGIVTWIAIALTFLPVIAKFWEDKLPNLVFLHKWYPRGVFRFLVFLVLGTYLAAWLLGENPTPELIQKTFPLLLLPAFIGSVIELLGRDGGKWEYEWPKRFAGLFVWLTAILLVLGYLTLVK